MASAARKITSPQPELTELAVEQLVADGWRVLARNVQTRLGSVDLVCRRGDTIIFVTMLADGQASPDSRGINRLRRAAVAWMCANPRLQKGVRAYRFDAMAAHPSTIIGEISFDHRRDIG